MCEKIISEIQDLTYLDWTRIRNSSGTAGSFLKACTEKNGRKIYYKLSNYDAYNGIFGYECINELFDHGLSFFFSCRNMDEIRKADVMENKPVQCFVGGNSAMDNLNLIPHEYRTRIPAFSHEDRKFIFENLEGILPERYQDKIWEMLNRRWEYYENFCDKR